MEEYSKTYVDNVDQIFNEKLELRRPQRWFRKVVKVMAYQVGLSLQTFVESRQLDRSRNLITPRAEDRYRRRGDEMMKSKPSRKL